MAPIKSFLCHSCMYEFDEIRSHDASNTMDCPRCEEKKSAHTIPSVPSTPRGSFGTTPRRGKDKPQELRFSGTDKEEPLEEQLGFDFDRGIK